ncbi:MAG TPA: hypothetical protein VGP07_20000 [Polyangia bacterium]|jgi:hypothetical protein
MTAPDDLDRGRPRLAHLRAARLRTRAVRGGIVKLAFGTVFLIGALAHALSPARHESMSVLWMTLLSIMSTMNVALGLKSVARARRLTARAANAAAIAWGLLAVVLLGLLLRR